MNLNFRPHYPVLMLLVLMLGLTASLSTSCSRHSTANISRPETATNQVSSKQAEDIATKFFEQKFGSCGGPSLPTDKGSYWEFETKVGVAGNTGPKIRVDKTSGKVVLDSFLERIIK